MSAPVRLALIGLGTMGMEHLAIFKSLQPRVRINAVADSHAPFAERAASYVPSAAVFDDPLDCVNNADVDAVVVATADATHHGIVDACIARRLFVLCEKPLTTSADQSLQLVNAEQASGRRLVQVGYMRRYDTDYQHIYHALQSGHVGEPILISQRHRNPLAVITFDEQQLIASSAAHDIDVFRWLCDEEISEVSAMAKTSQDGSAVTVVLTLTSQSGVLGVMELGRGPGLQYDIGCDIVASRGVLTLASPTLTSCVTADGGAAQRMPDAWMARFHRAYCSQDAAWLAAVATQSHTGPSAYDGYATNAVVDAALASLVSGRRQLVAQEKESTLVRQDGLRHWLDHRHHVVAVGGVGGVRGGVDDHTLRVFTDFDGGGDGAAGGVDDRHGVGALGHVGGVRGGLDDNPLRVFAAGDGATSVESGSPAARKAGLTNPRIIASSALTSSASQNSKASTTHSIHSAAALGRRGIDAVEGQRAPLGDKANCRLVL